MQVPHNIVMGLNNVMTPPSTHAFNMQWALHRAREMEEIQGKIKIKNKT